ncbi:MAG TPA: CzcE family metal-binding protein [Burkholderiaceae bacterium]
MQAKAFITITLAAILSACAPFSPVYYPEDLLGTAVDAAGAQRTIVLRPSTCWVNVTGGEIIRFTNGEREFTWSFDGPAHMLDLQRIAPPGFLDRPLFAYIAPNPYYRRDRWK